MWIGRTIADGVHSRITSIATINFREIFDLAFRCRTIAYVTWPTIFHSKTGTNYTGKAHTNWGFGQTPSKIEYLFKMFQFGTKSGTHFSNFSCTGISARIRYCTDKLGTVGHVKHMRERWGMALIDFHVQRKLQYFAFIHTEIWKE